MVRTHGFAWSDVLCAAALAAVFVSAWPTGEARRAREASGNIASSPPPELCARGLSAPSCHSAKELEAWMRTSDLHIEKASRPEVGQQQARLLTVQVAGTHRGDRAPRDGARFRVKWRALSTQHGLNDPRKEVGAYAVQRLFLAPEDFVVPPTTGHCFDIEHYRAVVEAAAKPSFEQARCVFGTLSYWIGDAKRVGHGLLAADKLLDRRAFYAHPMYRRSLADTNLLLHLIHNGDTHVDQFVLRGDVKDVRMYAVDHTISFSHYRNLTLSYAEDWTAIHVPALSKQSIERLRDVTLDELDRLSAIEQYALRDGQLVHVPIVRASENGEQDERGADDIEGTADERDTPNAEPDRGLRWVDVRPSPSEPPERRLQLGLTRAERDLVWNRLQDLLERVGRGEIATF